MSNAFRRREEWVEVSRVLERHHNLFYTMWKHGTPAFTESIPTAALLYNPSTYKPLRFEFNPEYWDSLSAYSRAFLVGHECLHAYFNHGIRGRDYKEHRMCNIAMDVSINHILCDVFGFDFELLDEPIHKGCWVHSVFLDDDGEPIDPLPETNLSFEEYFYLMQKLGYQEINIRGILLDNPDGLPPDVDFSKILVNIMQDNKDSARDVDKRLADYLPDEKPSDSSKSGGVGTDKGIFKYIEDVTKIRGSRKWEKIIRRWKRKGRISEDDHEIEQWLKIPRRYVELPADFVLPSDDIIDDEFGLVKVNAALFLDCSGSCIGDAKYFTEAYRSMPKKRFNIKTFTFDTEVHEIDLDKQIPQLGGGTDFRPIQTKLDELATSGYIPDVVLVYTDGQGPHGDYKSPRKWHWFMSESGADCTSVPPGCHVYNICDFFKK